VVYEELGDAKRACQHLSGYNLQGRYLIVLFYQPAKIARRREAERQKAELDELRVRQSTASTQ
jgi:pre-mRNA branch site protein p14